MVGYSSGKEMKFNTGGDTRTKIPRKARGEGPQPFPTCKICGKHHATSNHPRGRK